MSNFEVYPGISIDPDVRFGEPSSVGTRVYVATIVGAVASTQFSRTTYGVIANG